MYEINVKQGDKHGVIVIGFRLGVSLNQKALTNTDLVFDFYDVPFQIKSMFCV